jgi:D-inositol-3-phosphate glycosyltransferase
MAHGGLGKSSRGSRGATKLILICLHADPIAPSGIGEGGGTHAYLRELLAHLDRSGSDHLLLTRWADPSLPEFERTSARGQVRRLPIGPVGPLDKRRLAALHAVTVQGVSDALDTFGRPSLLHSVYWNSGQAAMDVAAARGLPFVHTVISNGWRREASGYHDQPVERIGIERLVFNAARRVFCICPQERDDLVDAYGVPIERTVIVGRPVAPTFLMPARDGYGNPRAKALGPPRA